MLLFRHTPQILCILVILLSHTGLAAQPFNHTIDDAAEDGVVYLPPDAWSQGSTCMACKVHLDSSQLAGGTWHDTTHTPSDQEPRTIVVTFTGTAVYVYNVLANNVPGVTTTVTSLHFTLDGADGGVFLHNPSGTSDIEYNVVVFAKDNLQNVEHTLVIQATDEPSSLILFDYVEYTVVEGTDTQPSIPVSSLFSTNNPPTTQLPSTNVIHTTVTTIPITTSSSSAAPTTTSSSSTTPISKPFTSISSTTTTTSDSASPLVRPSPSGLSVPTSNSPMPTPTTTTAPPDASTRSAAPAFPLRAIYGATIGGIAALLVVIITALLLCRRRRTRASRTSEEDPHGKTSAAREDQVHERDLSPEPHSSSSLIVIGPEMSMRSGSETLCNRRGTLGSSSSLQSLIESESRPTSLTAQMSSSHYGDDGPVPPPPEEKPLRNSGSSDGDDGFPQVWPATRQPVPQAMSTPARSTGRALSTGNEILLAQVAVLQEEVARLREQEEMRGLFDEPPPRYDQV